MILNKLIKELVITSGNAVNAWSEGRMGMVRPATGRRRAIFAPVGAE